MTCAESSTRQATIEARTKFVYGETFRRYSERDFLEFMRPLELRLAANDISRDAFHGQYCLDAGCGGGRGTVLMAQAGAREVVSYDLAETNLATTMGNASRFGVTNVQPRCGSLLELPFPDETFDIVWCNGVLHHTVNPDLALREVTRVLKVGGRLWLYLYGAGGIYWLMVDFIRGWLQELEPAQTMLMLRILNTTPDRIAEFLDDWHVPILKRYTHADIAARLSELGFSNPRRLMGGMTYDTSTRRRWPREHPLLGEGDLRYWTFKTSPPPRRHGHPLPDVERKGSHYDDGPEVKSFAVDFRALEARTRELTKAFPALEPMARVASSARIQRWLRNTFSRPEPFDPEAFRACVGRQASPPQAP